ncbi:IS200/IS605 family accessory protein TnpB-related protein [Candidatus Borrarchaeum sp.]|uniref:IS200/IS605 family accessory protein TnpB-related protein n=1 Tax=Candidatus Borrarchaeum sp. TaxID=2846742 RepID=UPI00257D9356|nr:IS200/IS605 family accessory protein TnpB-related protein [Candidatus Borrarchaeum sp.]
MAAITLSGVIISLADTQALKDLMRRFNTARRRAFSLKRQGVQTCTIETILQQEIGLNSRYIKDAYYSIKNLPYNTTFGGLKNQRLREKGTITKEEYKKRRNALLLSHGDRTKQGNLNLRLYLGTMQLRINTCRNDKDNKWIFAKIFIPQKYLDKYGRYLDGSQPYTVQIKRRNFDQGYDLRISIKLPSVIRKASRAMTLDINAGHTDFAVMNKDDGRVMSIGRFNHYETQHTKQGKREHLLNKLVEKIGNLARHYDAEVVVGQLNTGKFWSYSKKATRKIRQMPQYKFRQLLKRLELQGIKVNERSEAYTSKLGDVISQIVGYDIHKCAAMMFALKVINYDLFKQLKTFFFGVPLYEAYGRRRRGRRRKSGLTAPIQYRMFLKSMKFWMAMKSSIIEDGGYLPIPGREGLSLLDKLKAPFPCLTINIW